MSELARKPFTSSEVVLKEGLREEGEMSQASSGPNQSVLKQRAMKWPVVAIAGSSVLRGGEPERVSLLWPRREQHVQ